MCTAQAGMFMQMVAADRSSKANARIMRNNAQMALFQANLVRTRGRMEEFHSRTRTKRTLGTARATIAANGFDVGSGSALDRVGEIAEYGELDANLIRYNSEMDARALETQADQYRMMASLERQRGKSNMLAGFTSMTSSLLEEHQAKQLIEGQTAKAQKQIEGGSFNDALLGSEMTVHPRWYNNYG